LRVERAGGRDKGRNFPALLAEWSSKPTDRVSGMPIVHSASDPYGCHRQHRCSACALLVLQGNCTFAQKARHAQAAGAKLLIVITAKEGAPVEMALAPGTQVFSHQAPSLLAMTVSKATGRQVLLALERRESLVASCWHHERIYADILSEVFVALLAVGLVMLGAWHSVEDLRRPEKSAKFNEEVFAVEDNSGYHFVFFGSLMLTILFFFMKYLIYILLFLFATGAVSTTTMLLEPVISGWCPAMRATRAINLPKRIADLLGCAQEHSRADALAESAGVMLAIGFLVFRNNDDFGWALQDSIAVMLLLTIQRTLRLPNLKVGTVLLICTFFFDIFWVFLSPLIFKKSVMIEVATGGGTGQSVPMVLKIPSFSSDLPGQFKILGLGDIAIPGLLISLLLRHDLSKRAARGTGYFTAGVIGYAVGLAATFLSLYLMKHGQPALLFLVPGTLLPTCFIARRKGELSELWTANYGPEQPPEGYEALGEAEKQA